MAMTMTERNAIAENLFDQFKSMTSSDVAGDQVAIIAALGGKVIASYVDAGNRPAAMKAFMTTLNAQLTLESAGEHRATQAIGRFSMDEE
jgi:hypothetical protein